jgi:aminomethyltransferase
LQKQTPLNAIHRAAGARMVDFGGWDMPVNYGSQIDEHRAVRSDAGMFDVSHMQIIDLDGAGARAFLRYALANNVDKLKEPGKALYSCLLTPGGTVIDDLIVYYLREDFFRIVVNAGTAEKDLAWLRRLVAERAPGLSLTPRADLAIIAVQGPHARTKVWRALPGSEAATATLNPFTATRVPTGLGEVFIARTGYTGEDGFELFVSSGDAVALWQALTEAGGADLGPAGLSARDTLRLEAGMPLYGNELSTETTPYDAGLGRVVTLGKTDDFVGREALTALAQTPPGRTLVGLVAKGRRVPRHGYSVVTTGEQGGTPCGVVTSGAPSPTLGKPIAMAYLDTGTGTAELAVDIRGKHEPVDVVSLPFYKRVVP